MGNNIFAYNLSGLTDYRIGLEALVWDEKELSGATTFVVSGSSTYPGYSNITSIVNWEKFGEEAGQRHFFVREEIRDIYESNTGQTWSAYTLEEKKILSKNFIVDKDKRDEVLTEEEQEKYNHYKLYHYISDDTIERLGELDYTITPKSIDYKKDINGKLHPKFTFSNGFLINTEYYETVNIVINPQTGLSDLVYENPILKAEFQYHVEADGYVSHRLVKRSWVKADGEYDTINTKDSTKYYTKKLARSEGVRRRENVIDEVILATGGLILMSHSGATSIPEAEAIAMPFLDSLDSDINKYVKGNTNPLIASILTSDTSVHDWLLTVINQEGNTIQQYLYGQLSAGVMDYAGVHGNV